jgi:hypothetical protein
MPFSSFPEDLLARAVSTAGSAPYQTDLAPRDKRQAGHIAARLG